jgi:DNA polymerase-3 subunit alpha
MDHAQLVKPKDVDQGDLFEEIEFTIRPKYMEVEPIREEDKLRLEKEVLGFYLSNHPVSMYEKYFAELQVKPLYDFMTDHAYGKTVVYIGEVRRIRTRKGEQMAFLKISDQSGDGEAVVFPNVYKNHFSLIQEGKILLITGKMEIRNGKQQFIVKSAQDANTIHSGQVEKL